MDRLALAREVKYRRASKDVNYFCEKLWTIQHPEKGRIPFQLRDPQVNTLASFQDHRKVIILKARQIGFSTLCAAYTAWLAIYHPDVQIVMLSKGEREAQELLAKVKYGLRGLPEWFKDRMPKIETETLSKIGFADPHSSVIESLPSRSDPARGRAVTLVIVDEWAFLENPAEAWASIEPITDIGGSVIGLSTANGSGTFFHTMWVNATTGSSGFHPIFYPWSAVPERDELWYESKRRDMLPWQLAQEYPTSPEEAFIRSGNPVFDIDLLRAFETVEPTRGRLRPTTEDLEGNGLPEFVPSAEGELQVWDWPKRGTGATSPPGVYVIGADVAEGLEHGDYSVAWVIDVRSGKCVAKWRGHVAPDIFGGQILKDLGYWYNTALIGCEVNNHGYSTLVNLRDTAYPLVYYRHSYDERTNQRGRKMGWRTQANTKPLLVDELAKSLRGEIQLPDAETIAELVTFVRDANGKMHGSPHDDQVIALGIAVQMLKHAFAPEYVKPVDTAGTYQGLIDDLIAQAAHNRTGRVGSNLVRSGVPVGTVASLLG